MSIASPEPDLLQPLREIYGASALDLPRLEIVPGAQIPEPYRSLLVHDRDMTRTLESHHGDSIRLRTLASDLREGVYRRMVALELERTRRPVEFGATRVDLRRFPEPWRGMILEGQRPVVGILNAWGRLLYTRDAAYQNSDLERGCPDYISKNKNY